MGHIDECSFVTDGIPSIFLIFSSTNHLTIDVKFFMALYWTTVCVIQ